MGRLRSTALASIFLAWSTLACSKQEPPVVDPGPAPEAQLEHAEVEAFLSGTGRGAEEATAYENAKEALAEALLGDARWLEFMPVALHDPDADPYDVVRTAEGWEVAIGLDEGRAATTLDAMTYAKPAFASPEAWHDAVYQALTTHAAKLVCERRASLYAVGCDAAPTDEEDAALRGLSGGLRLDTTVRGGVPTDAEGTVLRPGRVLATWNGAPMEGLPLQVETPEGETVELETNAGGVASLPVRVGSAWPGAFEVRVDTGRILGPLASSEGWPTLEVGARTLDPSRWALVFEDGTKADEPFGTALRDALRTELGGPVQLDAKAANTLAKVGPAERARVLAALADAMAGTLDVVVLVRARSRFASRAGGSRVWFEATSQVVVHEVWGAGELGREDVEATASGVGDRRADEAAQLKLAKETSNRVLSVLRPG